jgi:hypothetical protein
MKNLFAIQGHDTRGNEVIEILEMLGGKNENEYNGENNRLWYYINDHSNISVFTCAFDINFIFFTIDEFIKNFPYKVGDIVHNIIHNEKQIITKAFWCHIEKEVVYETDNNEYVFVNYIKPYKEEIMKENTDTALAPDLKGEDYSDRRFCYKIPNGYEFECVRKNEIILKPIKPQYPRDYDECCEVLSLGEDGRLFTKGYKASIIQDFQKLLICRDAYWKIAGEQMGLGKPWTQDYNDRCFIIVNYKGNIHAYEYHGSDNVILAFPTAEMCDAFKENFDGDIDACKEFL